MDRIKRLVVKKSLLSWIISGNLKLQILLLVTIVMTVLVRVFPLEMQKRIVNQALNLKAFDLLLLYWSLYLTAVLTASGLKYLISYLQTVIGQQAVTDMRTELYRYILTLPLGFFRKTQPGMVVQSLSTELATAGDFVGMAVAIPVTSFWNSVGRFAFKPSTSLEVCHQIDLFSSKAPLNRRSWMTTKYWQEI